VAPEIIDLLIEKNVTSYSFEYFCDENNHFPLMRATGEISGKQAVIYAAYHLQSHIGGSGKLLPSCSTIAGAKIAILGFGNVGQAAAEMAVLMGAEVVIFRWSSHFQSTVTVNGKQIRCFELNKESIDDIIPMCDVVIGAIRISTFDTPVILNSEVIGKMRPGSILIDVTAGYSSGYIETSKRTTTLNNPFYISHGVKHIKIRELPLGVHYTAAKQISAIYGPYIYEMIKALKSGDRYSIADRGIITRNGKILNSQILRHYNVRFKE